eukprot:TRINITY_DN447_c0_g1_i1.p1 TRINITY_DN447_c0_g1~~TRINITY_DN447_c0_g1_i1.p1  ORF type:complete len:539 (+),score=246.95 TRINITY_DN447_c0_g1_i1:41-1657(+)
MSNCDSADLLNISIAENDPILQKIPQVNGCKFLINGELRDWNGPTFDVTTPIPKRNGEKICLGKGPLMGEVEAQEALESAVKCWNNGRGIWAQTKVQDRIAIIERFVEKLKTKRQIIVELLMWEICKNQMDSEKEFDRTILYIKNTIDALKKLENNDSTFIVEEGIFAHIRRTPLGVALCLGPFNYPFNETYCLLIPAIIMGNSVVFKLPRTGYLCHMPTLEIFQECFPPGVINAVSGMGRTTVPPIMASGKVDVFAFIGTSKAADTLQKTHPKPHRLRVCLGLDAKNPAIVFSDADLDIAVSECISGALSFNGQRCTALKIIFVHESIKDQFVQKIAEKVDQLKIGLPWQSGVNITPVAEEEKPQYLTQIIQDAVSKGARIVNKNGGTTNQSLVIPAVLFPVNNTMRIWNEEQFGPIVPITTFSDYNSLYDYLTTSQFGQQASVFSNNSDSIAPLIDVLVHQVSRVNINSQCQRGPDRFPFTGRKDSAFGTLSVDDALRVFSIRSLVAAKANKTNQAIANTIISKQHSNFMRLDYLF